MRRWSVWLMAVASLAVLVTACAVADPPEDRGVVPSEGRLLGPREDPAVEHTIDLRVPRLVDEDEVSEDPQVDDREVLRTEIEVFFVPGATVGQVNALLAELGGAIVGMTEGVTSYVVRIPDPGSLVALRALLASIEARAEVVLALESVLVRPEPWSAPDGVSLQVLPPGLDAVDRVDHHLAVRGHAAWNARAGLPSLQRRAWFVIADLFGNGAPNADYDIGGPADDFADVPEGSAHGYHVLGIASGYFGASGDVLQRNRITGMFPSSLRVRGADVLDNAVGVTWSDLPILLIERLKAVLADDPNARIVINTSLNSRALTDAEREQRAVLWAYRVRAAGLEGRAVHVTSAGNISAGTTWPAEENSIFTMAALSDSSFTVAFMTFSAPRLTNTLVVENRVNTAGTADRRPEPGCLNGSNFGGTQLGGTISAMGTDVWSFTGPAAGAAAFTGTSMATPQVAAVAAYAWSFAPSLDAQGVIDLVRASSRASAVDQTAGFACHQDTGTPVIDAYDAVLAAGGPGVRRAILDVTASGTFTEHDLARYVSEFAARAGALDFSRYDLNGSGNTGGERVERFDLDMSGTYGFVTQAAAGTTLRFDERAVTDADVLCYYAFSELYQGDEGERFRLLADLCGVMPEIRFPPGGVVIRTIDPETVQIHGQPFVTLPRVELWTHLPPGEVLRHYSEVLPKGWEYRYAETEVALLEYLFESAPRFEDALDASALIAPAIAVSEVQPTDGFPAEASTFVRVTFGEVSAPE